MKRIFVSIIFAVALASGVALSQSNPTDRIQRPCASGGEKRAIVITNADGSIDIISCTGKDVYINHIPYPSGGAIGGSGTPGTLAQFTAATTIGDSLLTQTTGNINLFAGALNFGGIAAPAVSAAGRGRFYFDSGTNTLKGSYNGAAYFNIARSNVTAGTLALGGTGGLFGNSYATQSGNNFTIQQPATGTVTLGTGTALTQINDTTGTVTSGDVLGGGNGVTLAVNDSAQTIEGIGGPTARLFLNGGAQQASIGDTAGSGNNTKLTFDDGAQTAVIASAGTNYLQMDAAAGNLLLGKASSNAQVNAEGGAGAVTIGDASAVGNGNRIVVDDSSNAISVNPSKRAAALFDVPNRLVSIGDPFSIGDNTVFTVDDQNQTYTVNKLLSCSFGIQTDASGVMSCIVSDGRLKTNFSAYRGGLAAIARLHPQSYNFKPGIHYDSTQRRTGFVAQDVLQAIPEAVQTVDGNHLGVDNAALLATAVNAINELSAQVKALQVKLARLQRARRR